MQGSKVAWYIKILVLLLMKRLLIEKKCTRGPFATNSGFLQNWGGGVNLIKVLMRSKRKITLWNILLMKKRLLATCEWKGQESLILIRNSGIICKYKLRTGQGGEVLAFEGDSIRPGWGQVFVNNFVNTINWMLHSPLRKVVETRLGPGDYCKNYS